MGEKFWDFVVDTMRAIFMPLVCSYYAVSGSLFLNVSIRDASGLEEMGNTLLSPLQYLLDGKEAIQKPDGSWEFVQRFDYKHHFWIKTATSLVALPASALLGSAVKGLSFLNKANRERFASLRQGTFCSHLDEYRKMGLILEPISETFSPEGFLRRPGDERVLSFEKKALSDISRLLNEAQIPWWVDCGTCLGAYRYGGAIPWDEDVDMAVLAPDFENVRTTLSKLDPEKYCVQDWSTRDYPNSFIKVFIRNSGGGMIDIYHFAIDPVKKELSFIFALDSSLFFPEWFKIRERRFKVPVAFDVVFPLKRALFDGIEVFVPQNPKKYLQRCYGENLAPVKIYDPHTGCYEKDLTHPYWQRAYAH